MIWSFSRFSKINIAVGALVFVFIAGVIGYMLIESYYLLEAFYMTVITISTVGFSEVKSLSDPGKLFTTFLIISSFGIFAFTVTAISTYIITGEFRRYIKEKKLINTIGKMENHVIICGYGRNGQRATEEFLAHKSPFIVIEFDKNVVENKKDDPDPRILILEGDSREDEVLIKAKIKNARALISTLPDDADNLLTVLTARELNKNMLIVSRASRENTCHKLKLAGANNVIMPDSIGGTHMASLVLKPDVMEFFDQIFMNNPETPFLKEVNCSDLSKDDQNYDIRKLKQVNESGVIIIGTKTTDGQYIVNPPDDFELMPGSKLFILGSIEQIASFKS